MGYHVLDADHVARPATFEEWAEFMARPFETSRRVAKTVVGDAEVSTVFLAVDHAFWGSTPVLFETMVFGGENDGDTWRYSTWDEAVAGHALAVSTITASQEASE